MDKVILFSIILRFTEASLAGFISSKVKARSATVTCYLIGPNAVERFPPFKHKYARNEIFEPPLKILINRKGKKKKKKKKKKKSKYTNRIKNNSIVAWLDLYSVAIKEEFTRFLTEILNGMNQDTRKFISRQIYIYIINNIS